MAVLIDLRTSEVTETLFVIERVQKNKKSGVSGRKSALLPTFVDIFSRITKKSTFPNMF